MSTQRPENSPFVLIIRDGWGTNPFPEQAEYDAVTAVIARFIATTATDALMARA